MDEDRTVWCGNLSDKVSEELLYELFLQAAPLQRVHIPQDKEGRKSNFAFISFKHIESVYYATQLLNGTCLFDKPLNVKPRKNPANDHVTMNPRYRAEENQRRNDFRPFNQPMARDIEQSFDNLMQMGQVINASIMQPVYSSSLDRRPNNFTNSRNNRNHHREDRKPYSRNNSRHNRNRNHNYDRQRYY